MSNQERFPQYPEYRDSGIDWLGRVPAHWDNIRLKTTISACQNGLWGESPTNDDADVFCIRVADFNRTSSKVCFKDLTVRSIPQRERRDRELSPGDLLLEKSGGGKKQPVGAVVCFSGLDKPAVCSNFIARMPVREPNSPSFLTYLHAALYSMRVNVRSIKQNTGIQNLDSDSYLSEKVTMPSPSEQCVIAKFLDRETGKIDALIAKKERLIELLKEKRTALIARAVTKGLDPTVSMNNSGIEWLGEIPEHWLIRRLKSTISGCYIGLWGDLPTSDDSDFSCIRVADFNRKYFTVDTSDLTVRSIPPRKRGIRELKPNDLLLEKSGGGEKQPVGAVMIYSGINQPAVCSNFIARMPVKSPNSPRFLSYLHAALYSMRVNVKSIKQSIGIQNLDSDSYLNEKVALPSAREQTAIAAFLDHETAEIDNFEAKIRYGINRLKEYRIALISAAGTGKIDVRKEVA